MVNNDADKTPKHPYETFDAGGDVVGLLGTDFSLADEMRKSQQFQNFNQGGDKLENSSPVNMVFAQQNQRTASTTWYPQREINRVSKSQNRMRHKNHQINQISDAELRIRSAGTAYESISSHYSKNQLGDMNRIRNLPTEMLPASHSAAYNLDSDIKIKDNLQMSGQF